MSFSSDVKEELSKTNNLNKKDQVQMELVGYLISSNTNKNKKKIRFSTESEYNINRYAKLLKNIGIEDYKIDIKGKTFYIDHKIPENIEIVNIDDEININKTERAELLDKALVRGSFLGGGYVNNPEKKYHFEINFSTENNLNEVYSILKEYEINTKKKKKKK